MKKLRFVLFLFALVVSTAVLCLWYVSECAEKTIEDVKEIQSLVLKNQKNEAKEKIKDLSESWENQQFIFSMLVHHKSLEEIEESIMIIQTNLDNCPEDKSQFWGESIRIIDAVDNLRNDELPMIENII